MKQSQKPQEKHGQVEQQQRIDSFEAEQNAFIIAPFSLLLFTREDNKVFLDNGATISLDYVHNAAGRLTFFLCPSCGARVRFLYLPGFQCRKCSYLNYRCQQITKGSFQDYEAIPNKYNLDYDYSGIVRPRYMHKARFVKIESRFSKKKTCFFRKLNREAMRHYKSMTEDSILTDLSEILSESERMVLKCTETPEI